MSNKAWQETDTTYAWRVVKHNGWWLVQFASRWMDETLGR